MFKLFSTNEKPTSSHSRSKTQPHLYPFGEDHNPSVTPTATVNGHEFRFVDPISSRPPTLRPHEPSSCAPIAEPTKAHQRTLTEQVGSLRELPPLITQSTKLDISSNSHSPNSSPRGVQHNLDDLQHSPEQPRQSSPTRSNRLSLFNGDKDTQGKTGEKVGKLANWFSGESEPINISILPSPIKEKADPLEDMVSSSEIRPASLLNRSSTAQTISKPAMASRFSFFATKSTPSKPAAQAINLNDELIDMDISSSLSPAVPAGSPDPFSPAAFKNLQQQAEGLLQRLQTAYKERTIALHDMAMEKETLAEETEGAETRARHLKTQLDDMSAKLAEQDEAMMNLVDQLAQEKLARREEEEARKRSVRLVRHNTPPNRRVSLTNTVSDSGFESEDDSSAESVFSRRNGATSPTMSMSSVSTNNSPETPHTPEFQLRTFLPQAARLRVPTSQPIKTSPGAAVNQTDMIDESLPSTCPECNGIQGPEAKNSLSVVEEQNKALKQRVGELEGALDGCLDIVGRLA